MTSSHSSFRPCLEDRKALKLIERIQMTLEAKKPKPPKTSVSSARKVS